FCSSLRLLPPAFFPYTTLFRSEFSGNLLLSILALSSGGLRFRLRGFKASHQLRDVFPRIVEVFLERSGSVRLRLDHRFCPSDFRDRKSTRLNSSHEWISYAVFC